MPERYSITPPEVVPTDNRIVFLAGPIQGGPDWQSDAIDILHDLDSSITVASPRKEYERGTFVYEDQVDWETRFLRRAGRTGVVAFWLAGQVEETPGRSYAQTTRFELGEWKTMHQFGQGLITLGIEPGFGNERYIRRRFEQDVPDVRITNDLEEMCRNAVDLMPAHPYSIAIEPVTPESSDNQ